MEIGRLVSSVEPGTMVESNQEVWSQIRNIRSGVGRTLEESFARAKVAQEQDSWFRRAIEHSNKIPVVASYFINDVMIVDRDFQETE